MNGINIVIRDQVTGEHFRACVSQSWAKRNDNGALISCGLTVGTDIRRSQLDALLKLKRAKLITREEWNHSGCLSSCVKRGDQVCRW